MMHMGDDDRPVTFLDKVQVTAMALMFLASCGWVFGLTTCGVENEVPIFARVTSQFVSSYEDNHGKVHQGHSTYITFLRHGGLHGRVEVDRHSYTFVRHWQCVRVNAVRQRGGVVFEWGGLAQEDYCAGIR